MSLRADRCVTSSRQPVESGVAGFVTFIVRLRVYLVRHQTRIQFYTSDARDVTPQDTIKISLTVSG